MAFAHIISLINTIEFHFLQPLPCLIFDDKEMVESLCEKIRKLQGFLEESHKNNNIFISNQARRVLESKIRGVAHDAEGWIESDLHRLYMRFNSEERPVKTSQSLYQTLQQLKRRIESIERRYHQIERNSNHSVELQRRNTIENIKASSFSQPPSSDLKNVVLVGRDDEFLTIMQKLISDSEKREVISITGMGGIGKTTLVKRIYEDVAIISHFDVRAWITVSQEHNFREILIALHGSIVSNGVVGNSDLEDELRRKLTIRRYLIVIDDVWSIEAWDDIHRWFPKEDVNGSRILLTTRLKQVADYASSEDTEICVKALIRLWVAEGFLKQELNNTMEEVGENYLHDLVDRGLVQIDKRSSNGKMKSCRLHDRLHSFCLREVEREKLLYVINEKNVHSGMLQRIMRSMSTGSNPKARRWISSQIIRDLDVSIARASKEIRSILYFTNEFKWTYLSPKPFTFLKLLRVLDIRLCLMDGIPSEIVNLVHLRYLALRNDSVLNLQWLKLQSLQIIIINTFDDSESYWGSMLHVLDMPLLRHVYLPKSCFLNLPKLVQGNLQTIFWLSLPQRLRTKLGFKTIPNVKELGIYIKEKNPYKLLPGSLADLCRLENLKIAVEEDICSRGLFQLPTAFPSSLKKLKLIYTYLPWEDMGIIGTLPNLEVLKLMGYAFCGPKWRTENGFYKLKHLQIVESDLKHWTVIADHFPVLECLILSCCENLEEFPSAIVDITTLQLIKLTRCSSSIVTSAKQIQEERLGFGDSQFVVHDFHTIFGSEPVRQFSRREDAGYISSKKKLIYVKKIKE
ncbi:PREDICTED: putative late blight resistance protein homolog R1B-14 isoform X2 [Ipomoea nil]|uniref:putative late blight resistance protein homolog R1B-14 isoform X2 n=1 Tax=Ipomoea nil TaxID=35883 RepID=UPI000900ABBC|nr:PREDICTED: putative late blight resistance protein homolog R1B-14 isoform X2 [Ipomoea nil]